MVCFSCLAGVACAQEPNPAAARKRIKKIETGVKKRCQAWFSARSMKRLACKRCNGKGCGKCISGLQKSASSKIVAFLSKGARQAMGLKSGKARHAFLLQLKKRKVLRRHFGREILVGEPNIISVGVRSTRVTVLTRTKTRRGKLAEELSTWIRVGGKYYLETKHDRSREELATAQELELGLPARLREVRKEEEQATAAALEWLARHQDADGTWRFAKVPKGCTCPWAGKLGDRRFELGVTGLALLAFLKAGHTHREGKYAAFVKRGLAVLCKLQQPGGALGSTRREQVYNHAIGAWVLCLAYELTQDKELKPFAERATGFIVSAQNPGLGWKYGSRSGRNDTSVTAWMVSALAAAKSAAFDVPPECFTGARRWFRRVNDSKDDIGYETPGGGSSFLPVNDGKYNQLPSMVAAGIVGKLLSSDFAVSGNLSHLSKAPPRWTSDSGKGLRRANFYYWLYGVRAYRLLGFSSAPWQSTLSTVLRSRQQKKGCQRGSWEPVTEWAIAGGRAYSTAMGALCLEELTR